MGGVLFKLQFNDGTERPYLTGNLIDYVQMPEGKQPQQVIGVKLHEGREEYQNRLGDIDYYWCLFGE